MIDEVRALRVELATALKERDEAKESAELHRLGYAEALERARQSQAQREEALERAAAIADSYGCDYAAREIRSLKETP